MTLDMQEARAAYEKIQHKAHICTDYDVFAATMYLPVALDEIDRMQSQIEADVRQQAEQAVSLDAAESLVRKNAETINKQAKRIAELNTEAQELHDRKEEFATRITELEAENRNLVRHYLTDDIRDKCIAKQRAALKKLGNDKRARGKALVDERENETILRFSSACHWSTPEKAEETRRNARKIAIAQLRQEGKL